MTDNQKYDLAKKVLYVFQRLAFLVLILLLVLKQHPGFAVVFCLFYWGVPSYDKVRKVVKKAVNPKKHQL